MLTEHVYKIFNSLPKRKTNWVFAYSGGKDSTLLLYLFYKWLSENRVKHDLTVTILHNDTLGEINPMELWARSFMDDISRRIRSLGYGVETITTTPPAVDTFYWRVLVRGYPAPSYNFRWCVNLLKLKPTRRSLINLSSSKADSILLIGSRDDESTSRRNSLNRRFGGCPLGPGKCHAYYFSTDNVSGIRKIAPLRNWTNSDVWACLRFIKDINISSLLFLYGCEEARYGCWHCTLIKTQWGFKVLPDRYQYLDAVRRIYRMVSDIPSLRMRKNKGYSKRGALTAVPRSLLLHLFAEAEKKANVRLYGLDEAKVSDGFTLREVFYEMDVDKAMQVILKEDKADRKRIVHISTLRDIQIHKNKLKWLINKLYNHASSNYYVSELLKNILDLIS